MKQLWPCFEADEIKAASKALASGHPNQWGGREVAAFEREFARFVGAEYAVAFANGSLALEAAWAAMKEPRFGERPSALVPAASFVATAMSAVRAGYNLTWGDIDADGLLRADQIVPCDVSCVVHLGGKAAGPLLGGPRKIEDCAQALGARYPDQSGRHVGTFGRIGVFSFCQDKQLTTGGEGGMAVTSDYMIYRRLWMWKDHGKTFEEATGASGNGTYRWIHKTIGTNARMTEMQAAIGRAQLRKLPGRIERRRQVAGWLREELAGEIPEGVLRLPEVRPCDSPYRYYTYLDLERLKPSATRDTLVLELHRLGVPAGPGSCPEMYREAAFGNAPFRGCPGARKWGLEALAWRCDHRVARSDVRGWVKEGKKAFRKVLG